MNLLYALCDFPWKLKNFDVKSFFKSLLELAASIMIAYKVLQVLRNSYVYAAGVGMKITKTAEDVASKATALRDEVDPLKQRLIEEMTSAGLEEYRCGNHIIKLETKRAKKNVGIKQELFTMDAHLHFLMEELEQHGSATLWRVEDVDEKIRDWSRVGGEEASTVVDAYSHYKSIMSLTAEPLKDAAEELTQWLAERLSGLSDDI
ncbi:hypothetical protein JKP88DRAFT_285306 [Tribonema minus]|uniref:Uncharacterized protein n=1 Tax=Tribonema minus TaxID=303371 RepID=A0A835ZFL6_9STRA|nr:hypothetical protein JKP88DRAFT_285306 [Tribonema minus]